MNQHPIAYIVFFVSCFLIVWVGKQIYDARRLPPRLKPLTDTELAIVVAFITLPILGVVGSLIVLTH